MEMKDKILPRKHAMIKIINNELKNICSIEQSRHRSFENRITNLISGLITYSFFPKKLLPNTNPYKPIKYHYLKSNSG